MKHNMEFLKELPVETMYVLIAIFGGAARYFTGFTNGVPFKFSIFLASTFASGFSGLMFALFGLSLALPELMLFVMAGMGGFFGEQTLKFIMEQITKDKLPKV